MAYQDILFDVRDGVATITINRPDVYNAFRGTTCEELIDAFRQASWDKATGVIVFTGAGRKAFCTGGDQKRMKPGVMAAVAPSACPLRNCTPSFGTLPNP